MADVRVLVAGSDAGDVNALVQELEREGLVSQGVTFAVGVVEAYQAETFDLVLIQIAVHGPEAMDAIQSLMAYDPEALVVAIATQTTVDVAVEALKAGAKEFIEGSLDTGDLAARLREVVAQRADEAVHGNLRDLTLTSIISVNCSEHNQAELVVRRQGRVGTIYFERGGIVHASLDDEEGEQVIYELLSWEDGSFALRQGVPPPRRTVEVGWTGLLLEGVRLLDEGASGPDLEGGGREPEPDDSMDRVARALMAVEGVQAVVICSEGGEVLGQATNSDVAWEATLIAFMGHRTRTLGDLLGAGPSERLVLAGKRQERMIVPFDQSYVGLAFAERISAEATAPTIQTILRRYRLDQGGGR